MMPKVENHNKQITLEFFFFFLQNSLNDNILEEQLIKKIRNFTKNKFGIKPIIEIKIIRV